MVDTDSFGPNNCVVDSDVDMIAHVGIELAKIQALNANHQEFLSR